MKANEVYEFIRDKILIEDRVFEITLSDNSRWAFSSHNIHNFTEEMEEMENEGVYILKIMEYKKANKIGEKRCNDFFSCHGCPLEKLHLVCSYSEDTLFDIFKRFEDDLGYLAPTIKAKLEEDV